MERAYGDFWQHMLVAEGRLDFAVEAAVNLWDLAAVQLIVEEAGGRFTDFDGAARPDGGSARLEQRPPARRGAGRARRRLRAGRAAGGHPERGRRADPRALSHQAARQCAAPGAR